MRRTCLFRHDWELLDVQRYTVLPEISPEEKENFTKNKLVLYRTRILYGCVGCMSRRVDSLPGSWTFEQIKGKRGD